MKDRNKAAESGSSPASGSPVFRQEFMGEWVSPPPPAKVGDIAYNHRTGHCSPVTEALTRSDGRIYATLESGAKCVLPSPNWEYRENARAMTPAKDQDHEK